MREIKRFKAEVRQKKFLTKKVCFVRLSLLAPRKIRFLPGQFVSLEVGEGVRRSYSICSWPPEADFMELVVDISPGGVGSQFFKRVRVGESICFLGPMGKFVLEKGGGDLVFLATGTGVAPFRPMIRQALKRRKERHCDVKKEKNIAISQYGNFKVYLYLGFRYEEDIFWQDYFEQLEKEYPQFHFTLTLSRPPASWQGKRGYVQSHLPASIYQEPTTNYYLCGGRKMIAGVAEFLQERGVSKERIHFEVF